MAERPTDVQNEPIPQPAESEPGAEPMKKQNKTLKLLCGLLALALLMALAITAWVLTQRYKASVDPAQDRSGQIQFGDSWLDILEGLKPSSFKAAQFSKDSRGRIQYSGTEQTLFGIDVSHHQGKIDWVSVAADGVDFALIRVGYRGYTEGALWTDDQFAYNLEQAGKSGIALGLYFFSQAITVQEAREEAQFLLDALGDTAVTGPVVFDWERIDGMEARTNGIKRSQLTEIAAAFCSVIRTAGHEAMIYFNQEIGYLLYDLSQLQDYGFWLAEYKSHPSFYYDIDMWQYTDQGRVAGIEGSVDLNLCFGDYFAAG